ncbi:hypothetical protein [Aquimarina sp. Aq107]|uniref:hypothetical protein n=1 Tax=Aquimarina sp. Aq107 TaxID=1191912 RepID=UPI000D55B18D|nr:hypothetical protein [Aquimarina sp. Aq107]
MIDKIAEIPMFIGKNIIGGIFIGVALIILVRLLFKEKIETIISLEIIRWIIITYCFIASISWLLLLIFPHSEEYAFLNRATGPYAWAYWLMLLMNTVVPFILLNKSIGKKIYIIFFLTLFMNIGWIFEYFIIFVTSLHRDFSDGNHTDLLLNSRQIKTLVKGFFIGLISLVAGNGIRKWSTLTKEKRTHNNV